MTDEIVSDERVSKSLVYLAEHDRVAAELKGTMLAMERKAKAIWSTIFLHNPGKLKTIAEREAYATSCKEYEVAMAAYELSVTEFEAVRNKRHTEEIIYEMWRTLQANRRQG